MGDILQEIYSSLRNNKLRTALTGFAVSWGIFLLICLLGAGNGLMNSFMGNTDAFVSNSMAVFGGRTSLPANGYKAGRRIRLDEGDIAITKGKEFADNVDIVAPVSNSVGVMLVLGQLSASGTLQGVYPEYAGIEKVKIKEGRFIDPMDIQEKRKVAVISDNMDKELGGNTLGKWIKAGDISILVVGLYPADQSSFGEPVYLPYSTMKGIYSQGDRVDRIIFTFNGINNLKESNEFEQRYSTAIKKYHEADPEDPSAIWTWNRYSQNAQFGQATSILNIALWILGLLTLVSGIVGVSNIMLISVKERTREFGIRKAIGAKPRNILALIIAESVTITSIFGYLGMVLGMVACEVLDKTVGQNSVDLGFTSIKMLENPTVGIATAVEATLLLIVAGTIAGLAPALKASRVRPIEALNAE